MKRQQASVTDHAWFDRVSARC